MPLTGDENAKLFPRSDEGFNAAFDCALMRGRIDAVIACQDIVGERATQSVSRLRTIPRGQTCGPALVAIQAVTAMIVRDLVGSEFDDEDRRRGSTPPFLIAKAATFTREHFESAVEGWSKAFGSF